MVGGRDLAGSSIVGSGEIKGEPEINSLSQVLILNQLLSFSLLHPPTILTRYMCFTPLLRSPLPQ